MLALVGSPAAAATLECGLVAEHTINLDGLLDDWRGVPALRVEAERALRRGASQWDGPHDLSFELRCNHDEHHLFLSMHVVDDVFVRSRGGVGGDHVLIELGREALRIWPADLKHIPQRKGGSARLARSVEVMEALQRDGYSFELRLPLARVPGYEPQRTAIALRVTVEDVDVRGGNVASAMATPPLRVAFAEERAQLNAFLEQAGERGQPLRFDERADVCGDRRPERVLLVGRTIGVIGPGVSAEGGFFYLRLPVVRSEDIAWLRLYDLDGDRRRELAVRYVERAANGRRTLLVVYRFDRQNRIVRAFVHEIEKGRGADVITNRVRFERRHRRGQRDTVEIVIDHPWARGFTEQTFQEQPAPDARSILLPWSGDQRRVYRVGEGGVTVVPAR